MIDTYRYLTAIPVLMSIVSEGFASQLDLARLLQGFFRHYLIQQRQASPHTVRGHRDTFRLLMNLDNTGARVPEIIVAIWKRNRVRSASPR